MADSFTATLNLRKPEVGAAYDTWGGVAGLNNDLDILDSIFLATGLGLSVGVHVGTGKVLNVEGQLQIADSTDTTKRALFDASRLMTASTTTYILPAQSGTLGIKLPTGTVLSGYYTTAPQGFVFADGRTIGDSASGSTNRANADTQDLFTLFWNYNDNTRFPLFNADGSTGSRGANAVADFNAHKRLTLPDHSGATMAGRDDLSGTNRNRLNVAFPGGTDVIRGAYNGVQTQIYAVSVTSVGVSVSGGISGTASGGLSGSVSASGAMTAGGGSGAGYNFVGGGDPCSVSGSLGVSGSFSGSGSGTGSGVTDTRSVTQPTIIVDVIIAL